jgi:hypothetical protein
VTLLADSLGAAAGAASQRPITVSESKESTSAARCARFGPSGQFRQNLLKLRGSTHLLLKRADASGSYSTFCT